MLVPAAGTRVRRASTVSGENRGTSIPAFRHMSVWITLKPPELVMSAMDRPEGSGEVSKAIRAPTISSKFSTCRTPLCLKMARQISGDPAKAAVWEAAARMPCAVIPPLMAITGFFAAARIRADFRREPFLVPSM